MPITEQKIWACVEGGRVAWISPPLTVLQRDSLVDTQRFYMVDITNLKTKPDMGWEYSLETKKFIIPPFLNASIKAKKIEELRESCSIAITEGFTHTFGGVEYQFDSAITDQTNLNTLVISSVLLGKEATYKVKGRKYYEVEAGEKVFTSEKQEIALSSTGLQELHRATQAHVTLNTEKLQMFKSLLDKVDNPDQWVLITWDLDPGKITVSNNQYRIER